MGKYILRVRQFQTVIQSQPWNCQEKWKTQSSRGGGSTNSLEFPSASWLTYEGHGLVAVFFYCTINIDVLNSRFSGLLLLPLVVAKANVWHTNPRRLAGAVTTWQCGFPKSWFFPAFGSHLRYPKWKVKFGLSFGGAVILESCYWSNVGVLLKVGKVDSPASSLGFASRPRRRRLDYYYYSK